MGAKKEKEREKREERGLAPGRPFGEFEAWPALFAGWPRRFPRLTEELFGESPWTGRGGPLAPAMDVSENDAQYTVSLEIPGVKAEDVHVELQEGMLTIRGEKRSEHEEKNEQSRHVERSYGSFRRSFRLPADADGEHLDASFKDGVLAITIPKTEEAKPRTIAVKAG
jgi:HSP20 family protein